jgi:hypothetical protein
MTAKPWVCITISLGVSLLVGCESPSAAPRTPALRADRPLASSSTVENSGFAFGATMPRGAWTYEWNNTFQQWGTLHIVQPHRWIDDIGCSDPSRPADCGGFTGRSGTRRAFVHVYVAEERGFRPTRRVLLFAWGDDFVFEAALLPDSPGNRERFRQYAEGDVDDVIAKVRALVNESEDVVRGRTSVSNYNGQVAGPPVSTAPSP